MRGCWTAVKQYEKNGQHNGNAMRRYRICKTSHGENEELKKCEEALPRLKEGDLEQASRLYKAKEQEWDVTASVPRVLMDLTNETRGKIVEFLEKVEQSVKWPQQACTTMFFQIPVNVTSEGLVALMPTLIREALRPPEVAKWQQKCWVEWDATDGRNGEA